MISTVYSELFSRLSGSNYNSQTTYYDLELNEQLQGDICWEDVEFPPLNQKPLLKRQGDLAFVSPTEEFEPESETLLVTLPDNQKHVQIRLFRVR